MTKTLILLATLLIAALGAKASPPADTKPQPKIENLLVQQLDEAFTPGREVVVSYVEIPPHTTLERHWHPGEEFHYYMEGEPEIAIEGQEPFIGKPGHVGHVPFMKKHTAITKDKGAKVLVFRVHETGKPVRYLESGGSEDK